jgi:TonB family protein
MRHSRMLTMLFWLAGVTTNALAQTDSQVFSPKMRSLNSGASTCAPPSYPKAAIRYEIQGTVTLSFLIGTDGAVQDSRIAKTSGSKLLDETAREALAKCRFKPATNADGPVQAWVPVQYVWALK